MRGMRRNYIFASAPGSPGLDGEMLPMEVSRQRTKKWRYRCADLLINQ